jgi:hypothetical protein
MRIITARFLTACFGLAIFALSLAGGALLLADSVAVRQTEGQLHGFLVLRTPDGAPIADGDLIQSSRGGKVTSRLIFHFKDGSLQDETTVFSQNGRFQLLSDHLVQKGPSFPRQIDSSLDGSTGLATVRYTEGNGKEKVETEQLKLPPDVANGMIPVLLQNLPPGTQSTTVSMMVASPKPLIVKLVITAEGEDSFSTAGARHKATRFDIKVDIGGVRGVVAPLVGKQPPDTHVWILGGESPAFVKSEGSSCEGCPIWRTELVSPVWERAASDTRASEK